MYKQFEIVVVEDCGILECLLRHEIRRWMLTIWRKLLYIDLSFRGRGMN